ncbi:MAG: hypothetical protein PSV36_10920 [Algoriphagus sp.]|nr:hypothetical protein [Algoriphagus sp.]
MPEHPLSFSNVDSVVTEKKGGILRINGEPYSGFLFELDKLNSDTLSLEKFEDGKPEGIHREFYSRGIKKSERTFKDGKKEGLSLSWYPNGNKKAESNFSDGEYQGTLKEWTESGILIREMNYEKGHEAGRQQAWDSDGKQLANYEVKNGRTYGLTGVKGCSTPWNEGAVAVH